MDYTYYYEELPLEWIINTEKELEKRLEEEELKLAINCKGMLPAYIKLDMKNGKVFYVARKRDYINKLYHYTVELYNEDVQVIDKFEYDENDNYPLMMLAVDLLRRGRTA